MSTSDRGDRGALIAFAIAVTAVVFISLITSFSNKHYSEYEAGEDYSDRSNEGDDQTTKSIIGRFVSPQDTLAQWIAAFSSLTAIGVSIWGVILVRDTLRVNREATSAASSAVKVAQETFELERRGFVSVSTTKIKWVTDPITHQITGVFFTPNITNSGRSPAIITHFMIGGYYAGFNDPVSITKQETLHGADRTVIHPGGSYRTTSVFCSNKQVLECFIEESKFIVFYDIRYTSIGQNPKLYETFQCFQLEVLVNPEESRAKGLAATEVMFLFNVGHLGDAT